MTRGTFATLLGGLGLLLGGCGHRGDPLPPLRRTPPAPSDLRLAQRGELMELSARAPAASVDGVAYAVVTIEFLYGSGQGDLEKTGRRLRFETLPGGRATRTFPLPAAGTSLRAAARAIAHGEKGQKTLTLALAARPVVAAPRELQATLVAEGVTLAWAGERPAPLPTPAPPSPGAPGPAAAATPGSVPTPPLPSGSAPPAAAAPAATPPPAAVGAPPATPAPAAGGAPAAEAKPSRRTNGFLVYRRLGEAEYAAALTDEPLERRRFMDESVPLGATVCYVVRAAASTSPLVESAASNEACLESRDVSVPERPAGLALLPRKGGLEVLWSPSREPDIAGYRVYRASGGGTAARLAELPAAETSYLDATTEHGRTYAYSLTVFDRAGNESPPSEAVEATAP